MTLISTSDWTWSGLLILVFLLYAAHKFLNERRKRAIGKERLGYVVRFAEAAGFKLARSEIDPENRVTSLTYEYTAADGARLSAWITQALDTVHVQLSTFFRGERKRFEKWNHENATALAFSTYIEDAELTADRACETGKERLATIAAAAEQAGFSLYERSEEDGEVALIYTRRIGEHMHALAYLSASGERADASVRAFEVGGSHRTWPEERFAYEAANTEAFTRYVQGAIDSATSTGAVPP